ncbi:MAG: SDR family oxidoreductase [Gallionella sp.]|jgi:nucleoside-diphosphate-sugar epimerase|nr:SDR family oxidoreductase [Gallionella sp.]
MNRLLIVGAGDVALRTIPLLLKRYRVYALIRNPVYCNRLRALGAVPVLGDLDGRASLSRIVGLADTVLHFAPPPAQGSGDPRTRNLLAALSRGSLPQRLIYISTSGVYGDCGGAVIDETRRVNPQTSRAQRRVAAEHLIRDWAKRKGVNASILRVPGIYAADRFPLDRLQAGSPAIVADEDSYTNHIHADDLARIALAALRRGRPNRVYHAVDGDAMKMGDYFDAIADVFGLAHPPRLPREQVRQTVSPMMWSFMNESRRLSNQRLQTELRVRLRYPGLADALAEISGNCCSR